MDEIIYIVMAHPWYSSGDPFIKSVHRTEDSANLAIEKLPKGKHPNDYWIDEWEIEE